MEGWQPATANRTAGTGCPGGRRHEEAKKKTESRKRDGLRTKA